MRKFKHKNGSNAIEPEYKPGWVNSVVTREDQVFSVPIWVIENNPDWTEIKEEVSKTYIVIAREANIAGSPVKCVKRLSDHVIFSIGDSISICGVGRDDHVITEIHENFDRSDVIVFHRSKSMGLSAQGSFLSIAGIRKVWNEIKEKPSDYEILKWGWNVTDKSNSEVLSVRRLSDGEVFSVGDEIITSVGVKEIAVLKYLREHPNKSDVVVGWEDKTYGSSLQGSCPGISYIRKVKKPLLITDDGVSIYDKNTHVYVVWGGYTVGSYSVRTLLDSVSGSFCKKLACLSTTEKAKEWIINNKPLFAVRDIDKGLIDVDTGLSVSDYHNVSKHFENLAKSKL